MALKLRSAGYNAITMSTIMGCGGSETGVPGVISCLPRDYGDLINARLKILSKIPKVPDYGLRASLPTPYRV